MIDNLKKFYKVILTSALCAGVIFLSCAFSAAVPKGVEVNGVAVGGMSYREASEILRRKTVEGLKNKRLVIRGVKDTYSFAYPEINFKDNLFTDLKKARRGQKLEYKFSYYLCGMDEIVRYICSGERVETVEPYAAFNTAGEPFTYYEGSDGREVEKPVLYADIRSSLEGGFEEISLKFLPLKRSKDFGEVERETKKLASFTTYFDGDNLNRVSNIRLAAAKLNGAVLKSGEILSFNGTVGARTKNRGFLPAKIIENGEFTDGVGGGVCQVSTTLYNCALLSGLQIQEYHPHSLAVSYVPPSRDAMVSGSACDLKIKNVYEKPVYIRAATGKNFVSFSIYGLQGDERYSLASEVTGTLSAANEACDSPEKERKSKDGLTSKGYLVIDRGGEIEKVLLRKDKYLPVKGLTFSGDGGSEEDTGENKND